MKILCSAMLYCAPQLQSVSKGQQIALESGRNISICHFVSVQKQRTFRFHRAKQGSSNLPKNRTELASVFRALSSCRMLIALRGSVPNSLRQRAHHKTKYKGTRFIKLNRMLCHIASHHIKLSVYGLHLWQSLIRSATVDSRGSTSHGDVGSKNIIGTTEPVSNTKPQISLLLSVSNRFKPTLQAFLRGCDTDCEHQTQVP